MKNLVGQKFGNLEVIEYVGYERKQHRYKCLCCCGVSKVIIGTSLTSGKTKSCGCYQRQAAKRARTKHGYSPRNGETDITYKSWQNMITRCHNPNSKSYQSYGGRGITVCDEWRTSFQKFLDDVGPRPSKDHSIGRIDNNLGYFKGNVRWETSKQQSRNSRKNRLIEYRGGVYPISDLAPLVGIKFSTLYSRIVTYGWPVELACSHPVVVGQKALKKNT